MLQISVFLSSLSIFLCTNLFAADFSLEKFLKKNKIPKNTIGVVFEGDNVSKVRHNDKLQMKPASLTKIITAASALKTLPLNYKWESQLRTSAKIKNKKLQGDLCFYGGGNPSFLTEQLWVLVNHFKRNEITSVVGDLIIDESFFDGEYFDDKRMKKRVLRAYDAPVGGASFNWNSVNIYLRPGRSIGSKAYIYADPENDYVSINNSVSTTSGKSHIDIKSKQKNGAEVFTVSGRFSINADEKVYYRPIKKPAMWTGYNIKKNLKLVGTSVSGKVKKGKCAPNARVLASVESKDLALVIRDMMKFSNNFVAEILAKTLVQHKHKKQGNMDDALKIVDQYLKNKGSKSHELYSVSGLSYHNKMTANVIHKVLKDSQTDFGLFPELFSSMPISGIDGTLKSRMKSMPLKVRAKTGLLNSVVGLAGYAQAKSGEDFRFVLIYNGTGKMETWKVRNLFDKMVMEYAYAN